MSMKKCRVIGKTDHPAFRDSDRNMSASLTRIMRKVSRTFRLEFNRHTESMQCVLYDDQLVDKAFSPFLKFAKSSSFGWERPSWYVSRRSFPFASSGSFSSIAANLSATAGCIFPWQTKPVRTVLFTGIFASACFKIEWM